MKPAAAAPGPQQENPAAPKHPARTANPAADRQSVGTHRVDMRFKPETLAALDKMATEAGINRTDMMARLVEKAAGMQSEGAAPVSPPGIKTTPVRTAMKAPPRPSAR